jgi:hypothetical protein
LKENKKNVEQKEREKCNIVELVGERQGERECRKGML